MAGDPTEDPSGRGDVRRREKLGEDGPEETQVLEVLLGVAHGVETAQQLILEFQEDLRVALEGELLLHEGGELLPCQHSVFQQHTKGVLQILDLLSVELLGHAPREAKQLFRALSALPLGLHDVAGQAFQQRRKRLLRDGREDLGLHLGEVLPRQLVHLRHHQVAVLEQLADQVHLAQRADHVAEYLEPDALELASLRCS